MSDGKIRDLLSKRQISNIAQTLADSKFGLDNPTVVNVAGVDEAYSIADNEVRTALRIVGSLNLNVTIFIPQAVRLQTETAFADWLMMTAPHLFAPERSEPREAFEAQRSELREAFEEHQKSWLALKKIFDELE